MEFFVFRVPENELKDNAIDLLGSELLGYFDDWRRETNSSFGEKMCESTLVKKMLCNLPADAIEDQPRKSAGKCRRYHVDAIAAHLGLELPTVP